MIWTEDRHCYDDGFNKSYRILNTTSSPTDTNQQELVICRHYARCWLCSWRQEMCGWISQSDSLGIYLNLTAAVNAVTIIGQKISKEGAQIMWFNPIYVYIIASPNIKTTLIFNVHWMLEWVWFKTKFEYFLISNALLGVCPQSYQSLVVFVCC